MSRLLAGLGAIALAAAAVLAAGVAVPSDRAVTPQPTAATTSSASPSSAAAPSPIPPGYRIQIPRLGIDLAILEGDLERDTVQLATPDNFAFHLPGTAIPGAGTNSYIYAHARRGMFIALWGARVGDEVWITTPDGRALRYLVTEIHARVPPDDVQWAAATAPDRLTLQTSTGPNPGDARFIVIAVPG